MDEQLTFEFEQRPTIKGFPELRWTGKRPYRSTQYYPAQLRESYGEEQNGWINKIFWGDNLQVMSHLLKEYRGKIDLIYIDPPFDSKADYKKKIEVRGIGKAASDSTSFEEKQYGDIWTNDEYLQFMYERLIIMRELLSDTGSIFLHCDWHKAPHLRCLLDEIFGPENFRNEIIWSYKSAGMSTSTFPRKHDNIFYYSKTADRVFYPIYVPHDEKVIKRFQRDEKGPYQLVNGKKYYMNPQGKPVEDVWEILLANRDSQRTGYPTQKPEALIERIIKCATREGDLVLDCFMGSGTTQAVAMKLGRRFIGADINLGAIQTTTKRLLAIAKELEPEHKPVTYEVAPRLSMVAEESGYYAAASAGGNTELSAEDRSKVIDFFKSKGMDTSALEEDVKYTGFEVYNGSKISRNYLLFEPKCRNNAEITYM